MYFQVSIGRGLDYFRLVDCRTVEGDDIQYISDGICYIYVHFDQSKKNETMMTYKHLSKQVQTNNQLH